MKKGKIVKLIRKSNDLVQAKYKLNIWETRVFSKMLTMIRKDDIDFKEYRIQIKDVIEEYKLENQKASYEHLKNATASLMSKTVKIMRETEEGDKIFHTNIISGYEYLKSHGSYIDISFHPKMKPYLLQLKGAFTTYDPRNIQGLSSTYSIRVFEILKQYQKIGKRRVELTELKALVGALEETTDGNIIDYYSKYGNFKQRVILKAQRDLEKFCDISFSFEEVKHGRKVAEVIFYISKNTPDRKADGKGKKKPLQEKVNEIFQQLKPLMKDWKGYNERSLKNIISKYGEQQVFASYSYTVNQMDKSDVRDPMKYFYKVCHDAPTLSLDMKEEEEEKQKREEEKALKKADKLAKEQEKKDKLEPLLKRKDEEYEKCLKKLLDNKPDELKKSEEAIKSKNKYTESLEELYTRPYFEPYVKAEIISRNQNYFESYKQVKAEIAEIESKF